MIITALLPIKASSQRVPDKNFRLLGNKPLYKWVLDELLTCNEIDKIVINTDAIERFNLEDNYLDKVILSERPQELRGHEVSMNLIIQYELEKTQSDLMIQTHATNPFLKSSTISDFVNYFKEKKCTSLFSVEKIQQRFYTSQVEPYNHDPKELIQTQDLEPLFLENSTLYGFTKESFRKNKTRIGEMAKMYQMSSLESIDIDTEDDWRIADLIARGSLKPSK